MCVFPELRWLGNNEKLPIHGAQDCHNYQAAVKPFFLFCFRSFLLNIERGLARWWAGPGMVVAYDGLHEAGPSLYPAVHAAHDAVPDNG